MLTVMRSLVQPRLDYCSQLWSPAGQSDINSLEDVQRHFVMIIKDKKLDSLNYWEKLDELRLYSQERRRERYQIITLWKLCQNLVEGYDMKWQWSYRRGQYAVPAQVHRSAPSIVRRARECSFSEMKEAEM